MQALPYRSRDDAAIRLLVGVKGEPHAGHLTEAPFQAGVLAHTVLQHSKHSGTTRFQDGQLVHHRQDFQQVRQQQVPYWMNAVAVRPKGKITARSSGRRWLLTSTV